MAVAIEHGTNSGYQVHKCRCDECREYNRRRQAAWRDRKTSPVERTWSDQVGDNWRDNAACKNKPTEWWFPQSKQWKQRHDDVQKAKAICESCDVKIDCLLWVMQFDQHQMHGIWAGTTQRQRVEIQTRRNRHIMKGPDT